MTSRAPIDFSAKRRKLPQSFLKVQHSRVSLAELAATRLQRFVRWRRRLRGVENHIGDGPLVAGRTLRLVEPDGYVCDLHAPSLAEAFLRCLSFRHPLTCRELQPPELRRLQRKVPPRMQGPLQATRVLREELARWLAQEDSSLRRLEEDQAGEALQAMLESIEHGGYAMCEYVLDVLMQDYTDILCNIGEASLQNLGRVSQLHASTALRRGFLWPPLLHDELLKTHTTVARRCARWHAPGSQGREPREDEEAQWQIVRYFRYLVNHV